MPIQSLYNCPICGQATFRQERNHMTVFKCSSQHNPRHYFEAEAWVEPPPPTPTYDDGGSADAPGIDLY